MLLYQVELEIASVAHRLLLLLLHVLGGNDDLFRRELVEKDGGVVIVDAVIDRAVVTSHVHRLKWHGCVLVAEV